MFEYKHYWVWFIVGANNIDSVYFSVPGMVTGHHIIFREVFYFRAVSNDILFMISWTFVLTSVRTPTRVEKFHKQIATAKAILQGEFVKLNGTK